MKKIKGMQLGAVLAAMLIVSMAFVPAVSAQAVDIAPAETNDKNTSCGCTGNGGCKGVVGEPKEISGPEKDKWIDKALKNKGFKEIQKQLEKDGFIQQSSQAFTAQVENENQTTDILFVTNLYKMAGSGEEKSILFIHNPKTEESTSLLVGGAITIQGFTTCSILLATCLVIAVGCSIPCAGVFVPPFTAPAVWACLKCIAVAGTSCALAYCECSEYVCNEGYDEFCDNCP